MKVKSIITYGDSHAKKQFGWAPAAQDLNLNLHPYWMGPILLHTILNPSASGWMKNQLRSIKLEAERKLNPGIPEHQRVLFLCAGEIDMRCHVAKLARTQRKDPAVVGEELAVRVINYFNALSKDSAVNLCVYVPPPPLGLQKGTGEKNWFDYSVLAANIAAGTADQYCQVGPPEVRLRAHTAYRKTLANSDLQVMDITDKLAGPDGYLNRDLDFIKTDGCHVKTGEYFSEWIKQNL